MHFYLATSEIRPYKGNNLPFLFTVLQITNSLNYSVLTFTVTRNDDRVLQVCV